MALVRSVCHGISVAKHCCVGADEVSGRMGPQISSTSSSEMLSLPADEHAVTDDGRAGGPTSSWVVAWWVSSPTSTMGL